MASPTKSTPLVSRAGAMVGVHGPAMYQPRHGAEQNPYEAGSLLRLLQGYGLESAGGAVAHCKVYDDSLRWKEGKPPRVPRSMRVFLAEAKELGFTTLVAYVPHGAYSGGLYVNPHVLTADGDALVAATEELDYYLDGLVDAWLFGNEKEWVYRDHGIDAAAKRAWYEAEALCFNVWKGNKRLVAVGGDISMAATVDSLPARLNYLGRLPDVIAVHFYGEGGDDPAHLPLLREAVAAKLGLPVDQCLPVWLTECALGFEGLEVPMGNKDYLWDTRHSNFMEATARAVHRQPGFRLVFFAARQLLSLDPTEGWSPAMMGIRTALQGKPGEADPTYVVLDCKARARKEWRLQKEIAETRV